MKMDRSSEQHSSEETNSLLQQYKNFDDKLRQEVYACACYTGQADVASGKNYQYYSS